MSEIFEVHQALKEIRAEEGRARTAAASEQFSEAASLAQANGFRLTECSASHYQLRPGDKSWLINLYPGNQRVYHDRQCAKAPYLKLPEPWTLKDAVTCAAGIQGKVPDVQIDVEATGKLSIATIREFFDNTLARSSTVATADWKGFVCGVRCLERIMEAAGVNPMSLLNGRLLTEKLTDTDREAQ